MREIQFYRNASGDCPAEEFLNGLGPKQAQKVAWVLKLVKELPLVPKQYLKKLEGTDGFWKSARNLAVMRSGCWAFGTRAA